MSAQQRQTKVLRIGIVQDSKLVEERFVPAGEDVTVGSASKNTFVFEGANIDGDSFTLFQWTDDDGYRLRFTEAHKGGVRSADAKFTLDKARKDPNNPATDGEWSVPVREDHRGKINLGKVQVLFQFVPPPPVQAVVPIEATDFRPRLFQDEDDLVFLGFLALWCAAGLVFGVWVYNQDPPEITLDDLPDRFVQIRIPKAPEAELEEAEEEEELPEDEDAAIKKKVKAKEPEPSKAKAEPKSEVEEARDREQRKEKLQQSSAMLQALQARMIGTTGENADGTVMLENADGDYEGIGDKLAEAADGVAQIGDGSRIRGGDGVAGGTGDRNVGDIEAGTDGGGDLGSAPKVEVKPTMSTGDLDFDGSDASGVSAVVKKYRGRLKYCYEKALKTNPSLAGRVVLAWTVEAGEAFDIYVAENTTGDEDFASCLKGKVRRWDFAGVDDGNARIPFVFQPQD